MKNETTDLSSAASQKQERPAVAVIAATAPPGDPPRSPPRPKKSHVARKDGRQLRRMTIYLPHDVAQRLKIYAARVDMDVSKALTEIVAGFLDDKSP